MSACPFRAFAIHRLGARELEDAGLGVRPRDKGTIVHAALDLIWSELETGEQLAALQDHEIRDLVSRSVASVLQGATAGPGLSIEQERLEKLLSEWLEQEKGRPPFRAIHREQKREITVGGVTVNLRVDRVDELADGRQVILDYKTGQISTSCWKGERPDEPQVPLYCITNDRPVAAAALVQIRTGDIDVAGFDGGGVSFPQLRKMQVENGFSLAEQIDDWRRVLTPLGERFRAGDSAVDPKAGACEFCRITPLCRIREIENA